MASRNPYSPSGIVTNPGSERAQTQAEQLEQEEYDRREEIRLGLQGTAEDLDDELTMRQADAERAVPRLRDDNVNPRKRQSLPKEGALRKMLSSRRQKEYSKNKVAWQNSLPKTRSRAMANTVSSPQALEDINNALRSVQGNRHSSALPGPVVKQINSIDRAIQDYERHNDREHVVYATLNTPEDEPTSGGLIKHLEGMIQNPEKFGDSFAFDGYIPATHSLGNIDAPGEVVMEIHTRSGAYLGTSDGTPNSDHIVQRGRRLRPVAMHSAKYIKPDGSEGERLVVQMEDVTVDGRTRAEK